MRVSWDQQTSLKQSNAVPLRRSELLKYTRWNAASKRFIDSADGDINFMPILDRYLVLARMFYGWFERKVRAEAGVLVAEYVHKSNEFALWLAELHAAPDWTDSDDPDNPPVPIPGTLFANRCRETLKRAEYGTSGWRTITVDPPASRWRVIPTGRHCRNSVAKACILPVTSLPDHRHQQGCHFCARVTVGK
jgi:hypothetical protein